MGLPLSEPDPVVRLRRINEETTLRKGAGDALVLDTLLGDLARLAPPLRHVLDRLTVHPRAFALAPGGDSGAQPTAVAISSGGRKWPLQTDVGTIILRV